MEFKFFYHFGKYLIFMRRIFAKPVKFRLFLKQLAHEMNSLGVESLPIVAIIAVFLGAVTTVQTAYQLVTGFISKSVIGTVVSDSIFLELAPTITCLVLAGKIGSNIASEIGTMKVSEQIDALEVMGINSASHLALPKILAGIVMIPILVVMAIFVAELGGMKAGEWSGVLTHDQYMTGARSTFKTFTLIFAMIKAFTFAFIICSISAFYGYYTEGGALEVGKASTKAVVYSSVMILFSDYMLAQLLL
jgi:phospholipid/cholesterol/gamma-HCH transport system permease protein